MSLLSVNYPLIISPHQHCKNALYPCSSFYGQAHAALNHIQVYRGSEVFRRSNTLGNLATGDDPATIWRWRFRSGYAQTQLQLVGLLGLAYDWRGTSPNTNTDAPTITISVTISGGATTTVTVSGGRSAVTATDAPSEWIPFEETIAITPATVYECSVASSDYCRIISLMARQLGDPAIDDATSYLSEHEPAGTHPISDVNQQRLIEGSGNLLRQNRGLRADWCLFNGAARTRTSAAWVNLINNSSASPPTATSPGWRYALDALNTASRDTMPVEMAVYADITASTGLVTLRDSGGTDVVSITVDTTGPKWFTATGSLSVGSFGTTLKVDPGFLSDGAATLSVYALSLCAWEA